MHDGVEATEVVELCLEPRASISPDHSWISKEEEP